MVRSLENNSFLMRTKLGYLRCYITPTKREFDPNIYIMHVGTNDLTLDHTLEKNTKHMVNTTASLKNRK